MNSIAPVFQKKLAAMKSAAPRADLHITIGHGCWYMYGSDVDTARRLCPGMVVVKNFGETGETPVLCGEVSVEKLWAFIEGVRQHHSIAVTDILPQDKTHLARHVMVAFFPKVAGWSSEQGSHIDTHNTKGSTAAPEVDSDWDDEPVTAKEEDWV